MVYATCHICKFDFYVEDMKEDYYGAKYCQLDSGAICSVCGIYGHDCKGENK